MKGGDTHRKNLQLNSCQAKDINRGGKKTNNNPYKWNNSTIDKILSKQEYCGDVINFKTYSKSYKNRKRRDNPKENWMIFKDVHEPIIDRDTFEQVQKLIQKTKRRAPKPENGEKSMFADLLYCADCGNKLWYHTNSVNREIHFFSCSNYKKDTRGSCDSRHYIRADAVEDVVKMELRRLARFLQTNEEEFADLLARKTNADMIAEQKRLEDELNRSIFRNESITTIFSKLYEDNVSGKLSDEMFMELSHKYEVERFDLKSKIKDCRERLVELSKMKQNKDDFIKAIRKFMEMDVLTAPMLRELIDHIDVYEKQGSNKVYTQELVIYYRFVGFISIPQLPEDENFKADTRLGVEVEYIPKKTA